MQRGMKGGCSKQTHGGIEGALTALEILAWFTKLFHQIARLVLRSHSTRELSMQFDFIGVWFGIPRDYFE